MEDAPAFFVPDGGDEAEVLYAGFAQIAGALPASLGKRIYSITWRSDGEMWQATVGESLRRIEPKHPAKTDVARTLAIFPGVSFVVLADGGRVGGPASGWATRILAGAPSSVTQLASG